MYRWKTKKNINPERKLYRAQNTAPATLLPVKSCIKNNNNNNLFGDLLLKLSQFMEKFVQHRGEWKYLGDKWAFL